MALALVVAAAPATPARADTTSTPAPPVAVPCPQAVPVEWPVQDIVSAAQPIAGVQDMLFTTASTDGSTTQTEDGQSRTYVLKADVMFAYNKASLTPKARATLTEIAAQIAATNPTNPNLSVVGFTDSSGSAAHNKKLSKKRAQAVATFLASLLPASTTIAASGKGEKQPRATNKTKPGRALNRRVEITIPK